MDNENKMVVSSKWCDTYVYITDFTVYHLKNALRACFDIYQFYVIGFHFCLQFYAEKKARFCSIHQKCVFSRLIVIVLIFCYNCQK